MQKKTLIQVTGSQRYPDGSEDKMDFVTVGQLHIRQGNFYILYKESEVTGMAGVTTSLRVEKDKVVLNRMGAVDLKQIFEPGVLNSSTYVTAFGSLYLSVFTEHMEINLTDQGGSITLKYNLFADDELVSHNTLTMIIKEDPPRCTYMKG